LIISPQTFFTFFSQVAQASEMDLRKAGLNKAKAGKIISICQKAVQEAEEIAALGKK
jgi:3-methyladenine DNA glycosylase/8-oxoguanine DNA glycosylase